MKLISPHISRTFTATILPGVATLAFWIGLLCLVSFNVFIRLTQPLSFQDALYDVFRHPLSWSSHMDLAQRFWGYGVRSAAKNELALAQELYPIAPDATAQTRILGATTDPKTLMAQWVGEPQRLETRKQYWESIALAHPDYPDAFIQLAAISYAQGNLVETEVNLQKAAALDPNSISLKNLLQFIEKKLK